MLKKLFSVFVFAVLLTHSLCLAASVDRWEWIASDDEQGRFFDSQTIKFGTKEEMNKNTYKFYKVIDTSKIIVYIKTVYTYAGRAPYLDILIKEGEYSLADQFSNMTHRIEKMEIDYANFAFRLAGMIYYDADGNVLLPIPPKANEPWTDIIPNSRMERTAKIIRNYAMKNYDKVARQTNTM